MTEPTSTSTRTQPTLDGHHNIRDTTAPVASNRLGQTETEEPPDADQSPRPVSPLVARDLVDGPDLNERLTAAEVREMEDFTWEFSDVSGNTLLAADDLIRLCRQARRDEAELERTEGDLAVAVREANHHRALVAKVAELHQADAVDPDWCASCVTTPWPCPTAAALATAAPS